MAKLSVGARRGELLHAVIAFIDNITGRLRKSLCHMV